MALALGTGLALAGLVSAVAAGFDGPLPPITCAHLEAGAPGPADDILEIAEPANGVARVVRSGQEVKVFDASSIHPGFLSCSGPATTVTNIDSIRFDVQDPSPAAGTAFMLDLSGGELAPGATQESEGSSEIEIGEQANPDPEIARVTILGGPESDQIRLDSPNDRLSVELNADEQPSDPDLLMREPAEISVDGGAGADRIVFRGHAPEFTELAGDRGDDVLNGSGASLGGGKGNDLLRSGAAGDFLHGGSGADRLIGGNGADRLGGGAGPDQLFGGSGRDRLRAQGENVDDVDCGPQRDVASVDRHDHVHHCELVSR